MRSMMENTLEEGVFERFAIEVRAGNTGWLNLFFNRWAQAAQAAEVDKKLAAVNSLLDGWVSDADIEHIVNIWNGSSEEEQRRIQAVIQSRVSSLISYEQRVRLRTLYH